MQTETETPTLDEQTVTLLAKTFPELHLKVPRMNGVQKGKLGGVFVFQNLTEEEQMELRLPEIRGWFFVHDLPEDKNLFDVAVSRHWDEVSTQTLLVWLLWLCDKRGWVVQLDTGTHGVVLTHAGTELSINHGHVIRSLAQAMLMAQTLWGKE